MLTRLRTPLIVAALAACATLAARADAPDAYAIRGARIVTSAGAPIASGTVVIRDGRIEAVGADVAVPADAWVIDGAGLTVYPGLIDLGTAAGLDVPKIAPPQDPQTTEEVERWKRTVILRSNLKAADYVKTDAAALHAFAAAGVTTVLARPEGAGITGQSALLNVVPPPDRPQIGGVEDVRSGLLVVRDRVALHVALERASGGGYPVSLLGMIAFVRQTFLDAQHYQLARAADAAALTGPRPEYDAALEALAPALGRREPVVFEAGLNREIVRALDMAAALDLDPVIAGGLEADQLAPEIKARGARVIYSLDYPTRPASLAPDADEPLRVLRERAHAQAAPAALAKAGVTFGFESAGLKEPAAFLKNARRAVAAGLPAGAALQALTIDAARIAGAADRLGSIEPGKIANLVVTDGDLFADATTITHVFVEGRPVALDALAAPAAGTRRGR